MQNIVDAMLELTQAHGVTGINDLPGAFELKIDETWYMAVNGQGDPVTVTPPNSMEVEIPPFYFAVWYNGFLAGIIHPFHGGEFAAGTGANVETFVAAIEAHINDLMAAECQEGI